MVERRFDVDWTLVLAVFALALIGFIAISSADGAGSSQGSRQLVWLGIGAAVGAIFATVSYRTWGELGPILYLVNAAVLAAVLVHGLRVNGSRSWLDLGPFNVQPSEMMKLFTILVAARVLAASQREKVGPGLLVGLAAVVGIPVLLVALQPDFGTALTFGAVMMGFVFVFGLDRRGWALLVVGGALGGSLMWTHVLRDYQKARILTFLSPESDAKAIGYQIIQSRIAIGSGGLGGQGLGGGTQSQLDFLPEKSTDFVFAVIGEAWGFAGTLVVLALYVFIVLRGLRIAMDARDAFGAYLVLGIMILLSTHVLVNLGMVTGLMPTIGIPLPLLSYGGSSVVTTMAGIGLVLNVSMRRIANG